MENKFEVLTEEVFKEFLDNWGKGNIAILCPTEELDREFCKRLHKEGKKWCDGDSYLDFTKWESHKENTCYSNSGGFADLEHYIERGYEIYEFKGFKTPLKEKEILQLQKEILKKEYELKSLEIDYKLERLERLEDLQKEKDKLKVN